MPVVSVLNLLSLRPCWDEWYCLRQAQDYTHMAEGYSLSRPSSLCSSTPQTLGSQAVHIHHLEFLLSVTKYTQLLPPCIAFPASYPSANPTGGCLIFFFLAPCQLSQNTVSGIKRLCLKVINFSSSTWCFNGLSLSSLQGILVLT